MIWEYNVVKATYMIPLSTLNRLGQKGWELVSTIVEGGTIVAFFKRPIEAEPSK